MPPYEKWALEILTRADYDEYWQHPSINPSAHWETFTDTPTLLVGGWYDSYSRATFELFEDADLPGRSPIGGAVCTIRALRNLG